MWQRNIGQLSPICAPSGDWSCHPGTCPDQESNWWPFSALDDALTNRATRPGQVFYFSKTLPLFKIIPIWEGFLALAQESDFLRLNQPFISDINATWPQDIVLFRHNWIQFANILLRIFTFIFKSSTSHLPDVAWMCSSLCPSEHQAALSSSRTSFPYSSCGTLLGDNLCM